jgi:hypothetical protein
MKRYKNNCPYCDIAMISEVRYDAKGLFLTYACDKCWKQEKKRYRSDILSDPNYWHDEPIDE